MPDIRTVAYEVESIAVFAGDSAGELSVRGRVDGNPRATRDDVMILDRGDEDGPGCPLTIDGRPVDRWELLRWAVATRAVRMEVDRDPEQYGRIVAARFTAGAPAR
jgi:hypothetical protein